MAISNKFGLMVVTTGNKSEMSVGYATLYGDMNGGFNPVKDLYKTEVYRLPAAQRLEAQRRARACRQRDPRAHHHPRADRRASRKPDRPGFAAALRGPRRILERLVEREQPIAQIVAAGFDQRDGDAGRAHARPRRIQAPASAPGVKVTLRNFGRDRRYPIVNVP